MNERNNDEDVMTVSAVWSRRQGISLLLPAGRGVVEAIYTSSGMADHVIARGLGHLKLLKSEIRMLLHQGFHLVERPILITAWE